MADVPQDEMVNYGYDLHNFIAQVRKEIESPETQFVYGRVLPKASLQFQVSTAAPSKLYVANACTIECDDLQLRCNDYKTPYPSDEVHLGTYGILTLGEPLAAVTADNME